MNPEDSGFYWRLVLDFRGDSASPDLRTDGAIGPYFESLAATIGRAEPNMHKVPLHDAEKPLRRLLDEADQGEEGSSPAAMALPSSGFPSPNRSPVSHSEVRKGKSG